MVVAHDDFPKCASILSNAGYSALDVFLMNDQYLSPDFICCPAAEIFYLYLLLILGIFVIPNEQWRLLLLSVDWTHVNG